MKKYSNSQHEVPLVEAMRNYHKEIVVPFDVPIHKRGQGNQKLEEFMKNGGIEFDFNSSEQLDNILSPHGAIKQAENLMAEAFGAKAALFMVNGTSSAVQTMIVATCSPGDKIILPRNVHISVINAIIIAGAIPIYMSTGYNQKLNIALGISTDDLLSIVESNPDAKAILINNPTYYGICSDLKKIVEIAHTHNMLVLVDEAHGVHNYFCDESPLTAMQAGADFSAISMHKTGGALTQSAALLIGNDIEYADTLLKANLLRTSSASYILMSSIDIARKNLVEKGASRNGKMICLANYARNKINQIAGFYAWGKEICDGKYAFDYDETKLCINVADMRLEGIDIYREFAEKYHIQLEVADEYNLLALIGDSDTKEDIDWLINALEKVEKGQLPEKIGSGKIYSMIPKICISPREAFFAPKESINLEMSVDKISGENIMCYPPGIPIVIMGELITKELIEYIKEIRKNKCVIVGAKDSLLEKIQIVIS